MIGSRPVTGSGFGGLQAYLLHGRNGASPNRSIWTSTRNLPSENPEQAARVMQATSTRASRGTDRPVYHLSVSLAPGEHLDRPALERVADRLLRDLGLEQHQALIAEHVDGAQQHIHLMVNRVHPETRTVWKPWHDWHRIERSLRTQEAELGLRVVPGRLASVPSQERFRGTRLSPEPFATQVRERAAEALLKETSWTNLHASLARHGLGIQPGRHGRGLVLTDGRRYVASSKVARGASRARLEARLGAYEPPSADLERLRQVTRQLMQRGRLEALRGRFLGAQAKLDRALGNHEKAAQRLDAAEQAFRGALGRIYRDPAAASRTIERDLGQRGVDSSGRGLREKPARFGRLQGRATFGNADRARARTVAREEAPRVLRELVTARQAERLTLERLDRFRANPKQRLLESAQRARGVLSRALNRLDTIDRRLAPTDRLTRQAAGMVQRLGWRAVARVVPHPALSALRVAVALVKAPGRILGHGMER